VAAVAHMLAVTAALVAVELVAIGHPLQVSHLVVVHRLKMH
jgi:hypothetical protein